MMPYPDSNPDKVSGFEVCIGPISGIPTEIPTKCRDSGAARPGVGESRHIMLHLGEVGFDPHSIANPSNGTHGVQDSDYEGLPI